MEQVNVQDLQRLSESINVCLDAIRRVAPQLATMQQLTQNQIGWGGPSATAGVPWMPTVDPITAQVISRSIYGQPAFGIPGMANPFTTGAFGVGSPMGYTYGWNASPFAPIYNGAATPFGVTGMQTGAWHAPWHTVAQGVSAMPHWSQMGYGVRA